MESVGHSRLLKFLVDVKDIKKMAESSAFKMEIDHADPKNVESEVPGDQKLREVKEQKDIANQDSTLVTDDKVPENYILAPVITVTKQEATLTKGDLKLQKVSVTENISEGKINGGVYKIKSNNVHEEVITVNQPDRSAEDSTNDHDDRKRSRIPKFKQAVEKVGRRRRASEESREEIPSSYKFSQKRSSIPRLQKDIKIALYFEHSKDPVKPEEEFEKIYDEIVVSEPKETLIKSIDVIKVDDPKSLENKFEEIIHDYEENKVQPINLDKIRISRIPRSKRKSDHDIQIPKAMERTSIKTYDKNYNHKTEKSNTNIPMHNNTPQKAIRTKYSYVTNKEKRSDDVSVQEVTVEKAFSREEYNTNDTTNDSTNKINEITIIESHPVHEKPILVKINKPNTTRTEEKVKVSSDIKSKVTKEPVIPTPKDKKQYKETNLDSDNNMDEEYIPGKVRRILTRIKSNEMNTDDNREIRKKEFSNDLPRSKSVMSKIAMFENDPQPSKPILPRSNSAPAVKFKETEVKVFEEHVLDNKPVIVDEVLKSSTERNINYTETDSKIKDASIKPNFTNTIEDNTLTEYKVDITNKAVKYHEVKAKEKETIIKSNYDINVKTNENTPGTVETNYNMSGTIDDKIEKPKQSDITNALETEKAKIETVLSSKAESTEKLSNKQILTETIQHSTKRDTHRAHIIKVQNGVSSDPEVSNKENRDKPFENKEEKDRRKSKDLDTTVLKGRVYEMIVRMNSLDKIEIGKRQTELREKPKLSVSSMIAMFEQKAVKTEATTVRRTTPPVTTHSVTISNEEYERRIADLINGKNKFGTIQNMTYLVLGNGVEMPVVALGTALMDTRLLRYIIGTAIDMGYRAIDTAFIYGNEKEVGEAIRAKIEDGTVRREDLFIISKLWSTYHRSDLVPKACQASLDAMGLEYFDLYLIHNPMSFKEGSDPFPKIANVIQYSEHDYLDAWYGMEGLVSKGLVRSIGVSNFNSRQIQRVLDRARVKPVVNQVECHPYLSQLRLDEFCSSRDIKLSCFGVLGSKGTPARVKSDLPPVIDDPLVKVMAAGLNITVGQLLIRYQIDSGRSVVVKASSAAHLWDNLQALQTSLTVAQVEALHALNRNKRTFTFEGMGDTHRNYPFRIPF